MDKSALLVTGARRSAIGQSLPILLSVLTPLAPLQAQVTGELPALNLCVVPGSGTLYQRPTAPSPLCRNQHTPVDLLRIGSSGVLAANTAASPLRISNTGTGGGLELRTSGAFALLVDHSGSGNAVQISRTATGSALWINHTGPAGNPLLVRSSGSTYTATFENTGSTSGALLVRGAMSGGAVAYIDGSGGGSTLGVRSTGSGHAILATTTTGHAVAGVSDGSGIAGDFHSTFTGPGAALHAYGHGSQAAAQIEHANGTGGIALRTIGTLDVRGSLIVTGSTTASGTKSAVVPTTRGLRKVYTEESTEVWFTDYGFGRLTKGATWVPLDSLFAETVRADGPYHVFLQGYTAGQFFVSRRTAAGFEVRAAHGAPADAEFSYRLVARRRGFETARLEQLAVDSPESAPSAHQP